MSISHLFLAVLVAIIWGVNFLFVKLALQDVSPLFLCTVRFFMASLPAIFFFKRPVMPFKLLFAYGLVTFALQFSLLFIGMRAGMTPGMASLLMQVQIFFSMFFAAVLLKEFPSIWQIAGALVSFCGIAIVALHFDANISLLGFLFIMAAAAAWGVGNLITKMTIKINMIALVVWGSFVAAFPMLLFALIFEGPASFTASYHHLTWLSTASIFYIVYISTWVGYGVWNWLLSRYVVGTVVPFTLLVPIVGIMSSVLFLGEPFQQWKIGAGLLVIGGLCINLLGAKLFVTKDARDLIRNE